MDRVDGLDDSPSSTGGHVHVEQNHVRKPFFDEFYGRRHLVRLPDELDCVSERAANTSAKQVMVVDEEYPRHSGGVHGRPGWRGRLSSTSVPSPGTERITAVPPWRCILPRIDSAIPLRSPATASESNPAPRSLTNIDTLLGSASTKIDTELAPDHFAAFTVASLPAAKSSRSSSSSGASPTVTASRATPCAASTSRSICS